MRDGLRVNVIGALGLAALLAGMVAGVPESPVADATMRGDKAAVQSLIRAGADVNAAQGDGMTALHWAAERGNVEIADMLIRAGAKVNATTRIGEYTPLHVASRTGSGATVKRLLEAGSDARAVTSTGVTALHLAALGGSAEAVAALLDHGVDVNASEPAWGQTPLMLAAARNRVDAVQVLLARGADPALAAKVVDLPARQAVDGAARQARNQAMEAFRGQSEQPELWRPTPSQVAAAVRAARAVETQGAVAAAPSQPAAEAGGGGGGDEGDPGFALQVGVQGGLTALLLAVREGHIETVEALLAGRADVNQATSGDETSPILLAAINGHFDLVKFLLDRGANPNAASKPGATPLYAVINKEWAPSSRHPQPTYNLQQKIGYLELMEGLLKAGADPNARLKSSLWYTTYDRDNLRVDFTGATPFWRAAYATDVPAMKLLVKYGADPTLATIQGEARRRRGGYGEGAQARQDPSGLPPVAVGGANAAPILAASGIGYGRGYASNDHRHAPDAWLASIKYLVEEHGADVNARDSDGFSPLHYAAARGDNETILYLVSKGANVTAVARTGQTTADMANGPVQRISPFLDTVALLEKLGSKNNHNCVGC